MLPPWPGAFFLTYAQLRVEEVASFASDLASQGRVVSRLAQTSAT
jgi:hypothetical protein